MPRAGVGRSEDPDHSHDNPLDAEEANENDEQEHNPDDLLGDTPGSPPLSPASRTVKIAVTVDGEPRLMELDQSLPLEEVVKGLCRQHDLVWEAGKYALQFQRYGGSVAANQVGVKYVTEGNRGDIRNGAELKLTYSPSVLCGFILQRITKKSKRSEERIWGLQRLAALAPDRAFLEVLAARSGAVDLVLTFLLTDRVSVLDVNCCLNTTLWLLRHRLVSGLADAVVRRIASFVRAEHTVDTNILESSLRILTELSGDPWDVAVVEEVAFGDLVALLWDQDRPGVQRAALELMNTLADRQLKSGADSPEAKHRVIKVLTSSQVAQTIANNILANSVDTAMTRQLQRLQTLILRPIRLALDTPVQQESAGSPQDDSIPPKLPRRGTMGSGVLQRKWGFGHSRSWGAEDSGQPGQLDSPHYKVLSGSSVSVASVNSTTSTSTLTDTVDSHTGDALTRDDDQSLKRCSGASSDSGGFFGDFRGSSASLTSESSRRSADSWPESGMMSPVILSKLGADNLQYLQTRHPTVYKRAAVEEEALRGSLAATAERLVRILVDEMDRQYQPLVFMQHEAQGSFFEELFCRGINLLAKTRREMRARTAKDQDKVLRVVRRQFREALGAQPSSWDVVDSWLTALPYSAVVALWEKERVTVERETVFRAPVVEHLRKQRSRQLGQLVRQQRLATLRDGQRFAKSTHHRSQKGSKRSYMFAWLGPGDAVLQYADCCEDDALLGATSSLSLSSVTAVVTGRKCPHVRNLRGRKQGMELAFSLLLDPHDCESESLDFIAPDVSTLEHWVDGFNILLGREPQTFAVKKDLEILLDMEVRLQLLDLEGIELPSGPPQVPPPPPDYDFVTS